MGVATGPQKVRKKSSCSRPSPALANASTQVRATAPMTTVAGRHAGAVPLALLRVAHHEARSARTLEHRAGPAGPALGERPPPPRFARSAGGEYSYPNLIRALGSTAPVSGRCTRGRDCQNAAAASDDGPGTFFHMYREAVLQPGVCATCGEPREAHGSTDCRPVATRRRDAPGAMIKVHCRGSSGCDPMGTS